MYSTPQEAERAFYEAFEAADVEAMMRVWAEDPAIACVHPTGRRLSGVEAVRASWERIFRGATRMSFELSEVSLLQGEDVSVHVLHENITLEDGQRAVVIATNVYRLTGQGWRMLLHHASPAPREKGQAEAPVLH